MYPHDCAFIIASSIDSKDLVKPDMFSFGAKKQSNTLTSIVPGATGIAIARIEWVHGDQAVLRSCEFDPTPADRETDLRPLLKDRGLDKQTCSTLLAVGEYQLLLVDAPEVPPAEMRAAIRWRIQDLIDFHIDDAVIDVFDAHPNTPDATEKQLHVVVAQSSTVRQHINQMEQAGVNLDIIDIPELALRNIAAGLPEDKDGMVTLHFDQQHCMITLTHNSELYLTRTLDIGYQQLQETASNPQPLSNRLALEIQRSMDYYEHSYRQAPIRAMAIMPIPANLYGLSDALQQTLGIESRILTMSDVVQCDAEPDEDTSAHCMLAVGCALRTEKKTL